MEGIVVPLREMDKPREGSLWHMNREQLLVFMECKKIPKPTVGTGIGKKVTKRDLIQRIRESIGGQEPKTKPAGVQKRLGHLSNIQQLTPDMIKHHTETYHWGGGESDIEAYIGTSLPKDNLIINGPFVEKERIAIPHASRLWSTIVGFDSPVSISMWHGANDTLIVQCLGNSNVMVDMWKMAMKSFPNIDRWADVTSHVSYEPMVMKNSWIVQAQNGQYYSLCLMEGLWMCSLESLFFTIPQEKRFSLSLISAVDEGVTRVLKQTDKVSLAGRDTQHYAWNYDIGGWLVLSLMPFPYYFPSFDNGDLKPVPVDDFVRAAASGTGAMYLNTLITNT